MVRRESNKQLHIVMYRSKLVQNRCLIVIKNLKNDKNLFKVIPCSKIKIYLANLLRQKNFIKIKLLSLEGNYVKINTAIKGSGWLYFPTHKKAVGVVFYGRQGVVASPALPSREAYYIPLQSPILSLIDVQVIDFY
ncbi:hypothetical protein [Pyrobaculum sp.]|uniref:hypothetical protein n=1 Tax=Pyrobaculum sp. TaxID=2004705 RepID=UPI003175E3A9